MENDKYLDTYKEHRESVAFFLDKINRVKKYWEESYTDFLNPDEQIILSDICKKEGVYVEFIGGKGYFERAIAVMGQTEDLAKFPVEVVRIVGNFKFEKLSHRDYLGTILSLGIKREKLGDINIFDDGAEIWLSKDISDYICINLSKIKHTGIKCEKIEIQDARERHQEYREFNINIPSMRLDCIVSALTKLSRNGAIDLISGRDVKLNYNIADETSKKVNPGDLISIKGFGRFQILENITTTKSQRLNVAVRKFI